MILSSKEIFFVRLGFLSSRFGLLGESALDIDRARRFLLFGFSAWDARCATGETTDADYHVLLRKSVGQGGLETSLAFLDLFSAIAVF